MSYSIPLLCLLWASVYLPHAFTSECVKGKRAISRALAEVTAIVHCGHCGGSPKNEMNVVSEVASAAGWGDPDKGDSPRSHSAGFLRGMTICVGVCQQKSVTQAVASRASTNEGCVVGLRCANEWQDLHFAVLADE